MNDPKKWSIEWGGRTLTIEVGKYAPQTDASCICRYGDTEVLATVVEAAHPREGIDFFPLMVDYEEKFYAAGKIKGSRFIKREGRPTDEAILMARMIDRAIRPLFDNKTRKDVQVVLTVFSIDEDNDPDIPALIAASFALSISQLNWHGPISGMRIGLINGEFTLNPSYSARELASADCVIATTENQKLIMMEAEGSEIPESVVLEMIALATKHNDHMVRFLSGIQKEIGKPKLIAASEDHGLTGEELEIVHKYLAREIPRALFNQPKATKRERGQTVSELKQSLDEHLCEKQIGKDKREKALALVKEDVEQAVSRGILDDGKRVDGRGLEDVRPLLMDVSIFPRTHGSAHFSRGETQVVSIVTLGAPGDVQFLDTMETEDKKHFMHHYNFPPFSVGEVAPLRGPGRREIGHGALAEKAIRAVLPPKTAFPYTIRVVSEVLSSNGSSSMASACGSSLALMDTGVPITRHVAGIAMGLATDGKQYRVFTDLQDLEDGPGGMDFKICGTLKGITAIQMDTKSDGLPYEVVKETFAKARKAIDEILLKMSTLIASPRAELSPYSPRIYTLHIDPEKIGLVIGPQGKMINKIIDETGVEIDIEKDGTVLITSVSKEGAEKAVAAVNELTREVKVGDIFEGKVTRIMNFGAMVGITPAQDGMVHVSNLANGFVRNVEDVVKMGDILKVRVIEIDEQGRVNLTVEGVEPKPTRPMGARNGPPRGNGFRGGPPRSGGSRY